MSTPLTPTQLEELDIKIEAQISELSALIKDAERLMRPGANSIALGTAHPIHMKTD